MPTGWPRRARKKGATSAAPFSSAARTAAIDEGRTYGMSPRATSHASASAAARTPQEIAEQREEVANDVAELSAAVRRESFEMQADLEN